MQEALRTLNFYEGEIDGVYDSEVTAAVKLFQRFYRAEGFTANGEATPEVQNAALKKVAGGDPGYNGEELPDLVLKAEITNTDALWLRKGASTTATTITKMYRGEHVTVLERGETWSKVQYAGQMGYAMSQYLRFYEEEAWNGEAMENTRAIVTAEEALWLRDSASTNGTTLTKMYAGEHVTVLKKDDVWAYVQYGNLNGYAMNRYLTFYNTATGEEDVVTTATVANTNAVWLRAGGSTSAVALGKIYEGETVSVLEKGETWSKIIYNDIIGYSMSMYLRFADEVEEPEAPQEPVTTATVANTDALWLRKQPSTSAGTFTKMYAGETVSVLEKGETWSKVVYKGITGYSMSMYLRFADE